MELLEKQEGWVCVEVAASRKVSNQISSTDYFALTLLYPLFFCTPTLLCPYFAARLPCCALILFALTLLCPCFYFRFTCCALIFPCAYPAAHYFLRTYPAVPLFFYAVTPAVPLFFCVLTLLRRYCCALPLLCPYFFCA